MGLELSFSFQLLFQFAAGFGKGCTSLPFWENVYGLDMSCVGKELVEDAAKIPIVDHVDDHDLVTRAAVLQVCAPTLIIFKIYISHNTGIMTLWWWVISYFLVFLSLGLRYIASYLVISCDLL